MAPSARNRSTAPLTTTTIDRSRTNREACAAIWSANRATVIRCGRPARTPASMAAPMSLQCTCTVHKDTPSPTTETQSPSRFSDARSSRTAESEVSSSRYMTSYSNSEDPLSRAVVSDSGVRGSSGASIGVSRAWPVITAANVSNNTTRPRPPASTTPAFASTASCRGVSANATAPARAAAITTSSSSSDGQSRAASAAACSTDRTVPGTGLDTAAVASSSDRCRPLRKAEPVTRETSCTVSARPLSTCERITPEFPRAPARAPRASADSASPTVVRGDRSSASSADCIVCSRLVPVSPSGTGKTLIWSIDSRLASSDRTHASAHLRTATASMTCMAARVSTRFGRG